MNIVTPPPPQQLSDVFLFACALLLHSVVSLYMLPSFILRKNVAGTTTLLWLFLSNTLLGLNYVIPSDVLLQAPIYCDITTKIFLGMQIAVPAGMLCFAMDLHYYIIVCDSTSQYIHERLVRGIFHALVCIVVPFLFMGLHVVVQDHRFDIVKEFGCLPSAQFTFPAFIAIWFPLAFFAAAVLAFLRWHKRRLKEETWLEGSALHWRRRQMELVMSEPVYSFRQQRRLVTVEYIVGAWVLLLAASALILYVANGFVPYSKPQISRVDVFDTLGNIPGYLGPIHAMLWSGPVYTFLLFMYNPWSQFLRPYGLLAGWAYRLSNRVSFKAFERHWRSIFIKKDFLKKPSKAWRFNQEEEDQRCKFTALPKRRERKLNRDVPADVDALEPADRCESKEPPAPLPSALPPARPMRPDPLYKGGDRPSPSSVRRSGSRRKSSRRKESRRTRKAAALLKKEKLNLPLFPIPESPIVDMEVMAEMLQGSVIPFTREEQAELDRQYPAHLAEQEELAAIRAEMKANRF